MHSPSWNSWVRLRWKGGSDPVLAMRASRKSKRKKAKANRTPAYVSSTLWMATQNLVNMVAITAVSGMVLLALLVARHLRYDESHPNEPVTCH